MSGDYWKTAVLNWGVFLVLLGIVFFICRSFWTLARRFGKSGGLYALLGFASVVVGNIVGYLLNSALNPGGGTVIAIVVSFLWLSTLVLVPFLLRRYLKSRWES